MKNCMVRTILMLSALSCVGPVLAYPTSINIIPSADLMPRGEARIELELDGDPTPFASGSSLGAYFQVGLTDRLEVGLDALDLNHEADWQVNLKYQLWTESEARPAVAVGLMDMDGRRPLENAYLVLSRQIDQIRVHGGLWRVEGTHGVLGLEYYWDDLTGGLLDWTSGPEGYGTVGIYRALGGSLYSTLYYARNNTRESGDFVGLNVYSEFAW